MTENSKEFEALLQKIRYERQMRKKRMYDAAMRQRRIEKNVALTKGENK